MPNEHQSRASHGGLLKTLQAMSEATLTNTVVLPLLRKMHPSGIVEITHGTNEAGRDVICIDKHPHLSRSWVLCVQIKNHRISSGATAGPYSIASIRNQVHIAKTVGVVTREGTTMRPDEVWVINPYPFPEPTRRAIADFLGLIKDLNAHIIADNEFVALLRMHCADIIKYLAGWKDNRYSEAILSLSIHQESRAFGLLIDRINEDFHVAARICPTSMLTTRLLASEIFIEPYTLAVPCECRGKDHKSTALSGIDIDPRDKEHSKRLKEVASLIEGKKIPVSWKAEIDRRPGFHARRTYSLDLLAIQSDLLMSIKEQYGEVTKFDVEWDQEASRKLHDQEGSGLIMEDTQHSEQFSALRDNRYFNIAKGISWTLRWHKLDREGDFCRVKRFYHFDLPKAARESAEKARIVLRTLPKRLKNNTKRIAKAILELNETEQLIAMCCGMDTVKSTPVCKPFNAPVMLIEDETDLLELARCLLIEGPPGCGKTTLLRRLAVSMLERNKPVLYVQCSQIHAADRRKSPDVLLRQRSLPGTPRNWKPETSVILVDGIDEAPFEISQALIKLPESYHVVASIRTAFSSVLRNQYSRLELAPFTSEDRNRFFSKWFRSNPSQLSAAMELVKRHKDIDFHTRIPLLATVVAALVEKGYMPTTRNDIYNDRLDLLLGRWDHIKGVKRAHIPSDLKLRFLETLAFTVHNAPNQRRWFGESELADVMLRSLGNIGRKYDTQQMVDDLVLAAGVLVREGDSFSLGHLTFQEHLAGRYLKREKQPKDIITYLGNDWWREVLNFYAGDMGDLTVLIDTCESEIGTTIEHSRQLSEMITYAPYTDEVAVAVVKEALVESSDVNYECELEE